MIKTLLIDDNKIIREYFEKMIDWESMGFELVAAAPNGIAGWRMFCEYRPQLVISDVHMPGMTGLELAQKIRDMDPETMIIFISNYEDFSYIKGAMELGAYSYVLKHEARGYKLNEKLAQIREEIERRSKRLMEYKESQLILALTSYDDVNYQHVFPDRYSMLLVEQANILPPFRKFTSHDVKKIESSFFIDYFERNKDKVVCSVKVDKMTRVVLLMPGCNTEKFALDLNRETYAGYHIRCYSLNLGNDMGIDECIRSYRMNRDQINAKYLNKHRYFILPSENKTEQAYQFEDDIRELKYALTHNDMDNMCKIIDRFSDIYSTYDDYDQLCGLIASLLNILSGYTKTMSDQQFSIYSYGDEEFWTNFDEIFYWLKNKFMLLLNYFNQNPVLTYSEPVKKAIEYIQENYANSGLSIGEISAHVGLSANQLSILMKNETGLTTIKLLTNTRIDMAKKLLKENKKVSEIYTQVGYTNLSYFANAFKKACGETPVEYRRRTFEKSAKD
jgi:two-component system response regulator YesN